MTPLTLTVICGVGIAIAAGLIIVIHSAVREISNMTHDFDEDMNL